ncbi:MAG: alpha/beta hydrolase [Rhizobiaceae bacterium]|nr:alpha/beta hydrolase [Rhizobiaceae bacterium]
MPSLKSRLVAFVLRHTRKKAFSSPEAMNRWIARARMKESHRPPRRITSSLAVGQRSLLGRPVYDVEPRGGASGPHIVYLHGGAFCFEITPYHWRLIGELAERLSAHVTVPVYPLAPEHDHDAIFAMGMAVYRDALRRTSADRLVLVGDSAGGNMAVVLTMMAAAEELPRPSRLALISPGLDMTLADPRSRDYARDDPWLDIDGGLEAIRLYAGALDRADWRVSPVNGDLSVLPPTLILAGQRDMLTPGTVSFAERARAAGAEVELVIEPDMIHVWPLIDMPEARVARDRMIDWLARPQPLPVQRPIKPVQRLRPQAAFS